jgi:hypothetical protein
MSKKKKRYEDGGIQETVDEMVDFNKAGRERMARQAFNRPSRVRPDLGDSEDERMEYFSPEQKLARLKAYFGVEEGRSPSSEEEIESSRFKPTIPEGADDDLARKLLMLKAKRDSKGM